MGNSSLFSNSMCINCFHTGHMKLTINMNNKYEIWPETMVRSLEHNSDNTAYVLIIDRRINNSANIGVKILLGLGVL